MVNYEYILENFCSKRVGCLLVLCVFANQEDSIVMCLYRHEFLVYDLEEKDRIVNI